MCERKDIRHFLLAHHTHSVMYDPCSLAPKAGGGKGVKLILQSDQTIFFFSLADL